MEIMKKLELLWTFIFRSWASDKMVFVVSSGRTGTNFLAHWFNLFSNEIYAVHEPKPDLFWEGVNRFRKDESISKKYLKYKRIRQLNSFKKSGKRIYLESNPNLILILPELKEAFPKSKMIFIKRDFESYFQSAFNKSPDKSNENYFYANTDSRQRITAMDFEDDEYSRQWKEFSREEKIAWWWQKSNELINDYHDNHNNSIVLNFEDLFINQNSSVLEHLIEFVGLDINGVDSNKLSHFDKKRNFNEVKKIDSIYELDLDIRNRIYDIVKKSNRKDLI